MQRSMTMRYLLFSLFALALISSFSPIKAQSLSEWNQKSYASAYGNGQTFYYLEYLPEGYHDSNTEYPVIISLHGLGYATEGTGIYWNRLKGADFERTIEAGRDYPFIVLTPHQPTEVAGRYNYSGTNPDGSAMKEDSLRWDPEIIDEVLERAKTALRIDTERVYLLGSSMGGGGIWSYLQKHGEKIAAAVPIAGYTVFSDESGDINAYTEYPAHLACNEKVKNTPIWAFHAENDNRISPLYAYKGVKAVNNCTPAPSPLARLTMFASGGHVNVQQKIFEYTGIADDYALSTDATYSNGVTQSVYKPDQAFNNDIFGWFLSYSKTQSAESNLLVDLGDDYFTVPANTSTKISSNVTGDVTSYYWTQISGPNTANLSGQNSATLTARNLQVDKTYSAQSRPEGYIFRLTVTDIYGNTAYDEINVKLAVPNLGNNIQQYNYTKKTGGWDTSPYLSYTYGLPFRLLYPKDYKSSPDGKKYPLILFIHGVGERGTENDFQLKNGGKIHLDAVNSGKFEGFVLFPQYDRNIPSDHDLDQMVKIINELIAHDKVDINRIHVHGLSAGGFGSWKMVIKHPKVFASAMPMSWSEEQFRYNDNLKKYIHIPLWVSQGGTDKNPPPTRTNDLIKRIRDAGANVRYLYYPNNGHNTWDDTYKQPDFFPFFMERHKTDIHVYYGQTSFCEDDNINVRLGITAGFDGYEWQKDGSNFQTGVNEITVTEEGYYKVRFRRGSVWTDWSKPVHINRQRDPSPTPQLSARKKSTHLPSLDGSEEVTLYATEGYAQYFWFKDGQLINNATSSILTVSEAGKYTVTATEADEVPNPDIPDEYRVEPARCESLPSAPIVVTTQSGPDAPKTPINLFALVKSEVSVELKFDDQASNELNFEIYRANQSGGPYNIVDIIPANNAANPVSYIDNNLKEGTAYFYKVRAVNNDGASAYSNEANTTTPIDKEAPSVPQHLKIVTSTSSSITLNWDASTDNVGVTEYQIYQDGSLVATSKTTEYTASGLTPESVHTYFVKAKDASGNVSSGSNQVVGAAVNSGLFYTYYHVRGINTVDNIKSKGTEIKTGRIDNFSLDPREQEDHFAFIYEGFINIEKAGSYTFYLKSDDGSRLYINDQMVVNHDGDHGCNEKSNTITLAAGTYPIKVDYYEAAGGACLEVRWRSADFNKQLIPDAVLKGDFDYPDGPAMPANLKVAAVSYKQINLRWDDQSNDETGFEIYRATSASGTYKIVHTTKANEAAYADTTLTGNTTYYYKIRAINTKGASAHTEAESGKTFATPPAPVKPTELTATATSPSSIRLNWKDASNNETGFEIWRTTASTGNGAVLIETVPANQNFYLDSSLPGNTALYYKIRAIGDGGPSGFTTLVSATTSNSNPELLDILSRTVKFNTTLSFKVFAKDADMNDIINFEATGLPSFGSFINNEDKTGTFTFSPGNGDAGSYPVQIKALDNHGGSSTKSFTITVNNNNTPVIAAIENQQVSQGKTLNINVTATDQDGNTALQLSLANHPDFMTITDQGDGKGVITIRPGINEIAGEYPNIQIVAQDQQGGVGTYTFDLLVKGVDKDFTVYINFSHGEHAPFPWNNTGDANNANNVLSDMIDTEGKKTGISLKLRQDNGPSWFSKRTTVESDLYTADVRNTRYSSYSTPPVTMTMKGLNPLLRYNFTFFGSSNEPDRENRTRVTRYAIGNKSGEIETFNNVKETVNLNNIQPDENGEVKITVSKKSSAEWLMSINAIVLQGFYDNGSIPAAPGNLLAKDLSPSQVKLTWEDHAKNEEGYEILRATNSNGPFTLVTTTQSNVVTFTDENLSGRTTYFYQVRAFNANGNSEGSNVATVNTPNSAPNIELPDGFVVKVGTTQTITIKGTDPENDQVTLSATGLPSFAGFTDHGDGTATLVLAPFSNKSAGNYELTFTAVDDRSDSETKKVIATVIADEFDNAVYINFGETTAGSPWNNTHGAPVSNQPIDNLKDAFGNASQISLTPVSGWNGADKLGVTTGNNTGIYADSVMQSYWFSNNSASIRFSGLAANKIYNFVFFASNQTTQEGSTAYTINGHTVQLNAANNSQKTAQLNGLTPDSNGQLVLNVSKGQYSTGAYLGAIVIQSYADQTPITPVKLKAQAQSQTDVKLTWTDQAGNETGYQVYRSLSPYDSYTLIASLGSNTNSYTDKTGTKNTTYYYKVQAVSNLLTSDYSNIASTTTYEYLVYINFVGNDPKYQYPGAPWNNTKVAPFTGLSFNNLKNSNGTTTAVDLVFAEWEDSGFDNNLGINTGNNSGIYPDAILESFYFVEVEGGYVTMSVKDLSADYQYSFIFMGSGDPDISLFQTSGNLTTKYTIGQQSVQQNALNNIHETVQIDGVIPSEDNDVYVDIRKETYANYGIFNAMVIGAYTPSQEIVDEEAPSTPANLVASEIAPASITLTWNPSTDNSGEIAYYEIYNGEQFIKKVNGSANAQLIENTLPSIDYQFSVLAVDAAGNRSQNSEVLSVNYEVFGGLNYAYYEGAWTSMPDYQKTASKKTGYVDNFSLAPKERNEDFGFRFYGFIQIDNPGDYTFYTKSNTGSKLYINQQEIVNNDFVNDASERSGVAYNLEAGLHAIMVDYRNATEADLLEVRYAGPGVNKMLIPDGKLYRTDTITPVSQPVEFLDVKASLISGSVTVDWSTASEDDNEKFTIEKSYNLDTFVSVGEVAGAGNSNEIRNYSFTDHHLKTGNIYYRIKQTDFEGKEQYSKIVSVYVSDLNQLYEVKLFPNPTESDNINIQVLSNDFSNPVRIAMVDLSGRVISEISLPGSDLGAGKRLDIASTITTGTYIIRITQGSNTVYRRVIIR